MESIISQIIDMFSLESIESGWPPGTRLVSPNKAQLAILKRGRGRLKKLMKSARIDLQWIRNGYAGVAVQIGHQTYAQVNLKVGRVYGRDEIRRRLQVSLERGGEVMRDDNTL